MDRVPPSPSLEMRIRPASSEDAGLLARIADAWFRDAFAEQNDPAQMDLYCAEHFGVAQQQAELADPKGIALLAEESGEPVGFAQLRFESRPALAVGNAPVEVQRFYVARSHHGSGVARALMQRCMEVSSAAGADSIWLAVWQDNPRAIAFYRKCGFAVVAQQEFLLGTEIQQDHVMMRSLVK